MRLHKASACHVDMKAHWADNSHNNSNANNKDSNHRSNHSSSSSSSSSRLHGVCLRPRGLALGWGLGLEGLWISNPKP